VLDHIEGRDQVEGFLLERKAAGARLRHLPQAPVVAITDGFQVHVHAPRISELRQVRQHGPGSTADVEDVAPVAGACAEVAVEDRQQDAPAADEPPVDVFDPVVFPVELSLQISREPV
jgi:hypothetical protein